MQLFLFLSFDSTGVSTSKLIIIDFLWLQVKHMAIKRRGQIIYRKERLSAPWVSVNECVWTCLYISIFIGGRFVEGCFSVFSFVFYNVVRLWSSLLTYPEATGQTVWQGSIICRHCTYGHSLRSLLKGALRSFSAVARLVWAPASAAPCVITPGSRNTPPTPSMSTACVQTQPWTTHTSLQSPFILSCYSRSPAALAVTATSGKSSAPVNTPQMNKLGAQPSPILATPLQNKA